MKFFIQILLSLIFVSLSLALPIGFAEAAVHKFSCTSLGAPPKIHLAGEVDENKATVALFKNFLELKHVPASQQPDNKKNLVVYLALTGPFSETIEIRNFYDGSQETRAHLISSGPRLDHKIALTCTTSCNQCAYERTRTEFCEQECNCLKGSCYQW